MTEELDGFVDASQKKFVSKDSNQVDEEEKLEQGGIGDEARFFYNIACEQDDIKIKSLASQPSDSMVVGVSTMGEQA